MEKVTLITTVKNEEESIRKFLGSIINQTRKPDEIVVVDGESTDNTILKIKNEILDLHVKYKILKKKGNRSVGRNTAIRVSSNSILAATDAGCTLDPHWLERITRPFSNREVDVVAGYYKPVTHSIFEKCLAAYTCTMPDRLDKKNFLPSSRSVAFRKLAWKKVGGYPEELDTCEDLVFDKKLKKEGMRFKTVENAIVYWPQRKNILQAAIQFFTYAKGDGRARYFRKSTPFLFARYFLGIVLFIIFLTTSNINFLFTIFYLLFFYLVWTILKNYRYVKKWQAFFYLPLLQITSDIMVILGMGLGLLARK